MFSLDELEAFDLMGWLANGDEAASLIYCNQSTISRRCQQVIKLFELPSKTGQGSREPASGRMLRLERQLHQLYRFQHRGRLRLHAPFWTSRLLQARFKDPFAPAWMVNPPREKQAIDEPLRLLDERIVDAVITEGPQRPADDDLRYCCIDLFQSPLYLCLEPQAGLEQQGCSETVPEMGHLATVQPRPYLSRISRQCSISLFDLLFPASPIPGTRADARPQARRVNAPFGPGSYTACFMSAGTLQLPDHVRLRSFCHNVERESIESLVVLRDLAFHPRIEELVAWLKSHYIRDLADQQMVSPLV